MRIGIRFAVSALVLTSIIASATSVHILWWRTAEQTSQTLARTIEMQVYELLGMTDAEGDQPY